MLSFANSQLEKTYLLVDMGTSPDHGTNFGFLFSKFVVLVLGTLRLLNGQHYVNMTLFSCNYYQGSCYLFTSVPRQFKLKMVTMKYVMMWLT